MAASSSLTDVTTPVTIFDPTDSSLHTCPSCSILFILHEHTVPRLYPLQLLCNLAFATKIQTLSTDRCLTVTATINTTDESTAIFINGAEITHPDLFNNGLIVVRGIKGYLSQFSPVSCKLKHLTTISISPPKSSSSLNFMSLMHQNALLHLHISGYTVLDLKLRNKYKELLSLMSLTVFGLDNDLIFTGEPNTKLMVADLEFLMPVKLSTLVKSLPMNCAIANLPMKKNMVIPSTHNNFGYELKLNKILKAEYGNEILNIATVNDVILSQRAKFVDYWYSGWHVHFQDDKSSIGKKTKHFILVTILLIVCTFCV